jgi:hypothetical protein
MLFDLRGRRRRAVQATYLTLALLMGGGLVFFGIGSDVSGGLFDVFGERGGSGTDQVQKRIERNEERLQSQPNNERLLAELVRDYYAQAGSQLETGATQYPEDARDELQKAGAYWNRYLQNAGEEPDPSLASVALQVFDVGALNRPKQAQEAARIIAEADNSPESYLRLVSYAALAGDTRTADLAAQKAVDLAPKGQKKEVRQQAEQLKTPAPQQ